MIAEAPANVGAAQRLIEFWQTPQGQAIPEAILERAKLCLLDALGCGLFGSRQPDSQIMSTVVLADRSRGDCTLLGSSDTLAPAQAALCNGTAMHGFELDDLLPKSLIHPGTVIVPAVLAAAEAADASGHAMLRGIVIGYEAMSRLSLAIGTEASHRGFHKTGVVGPVAAAIAAGVVMGLSSGQILSAAGLACSTASGIKAFAGGSGGGMVKGMHGGRAAESGVRMAMLAQSGYTGPPAAIDGRYGLLEVFAGSHAEPAQLWSGLGEEWAMDGLWVKVFPVCGWIQGVMQLLLDMRGAEPLALERIERVTVGTSAFSVKNNANTAPADTMEAQYSIPYCVSVALAADPRDPDQFAPAAFTDPVRRAIAQRVELTVDEESEAVFPKQFGSRVRLHLDDGQVKEAATLDPHGTAADPCTADEVIAKFRRLAAFSSAATHADAVIDAITNMDASTRARGIARILRGDERQGQ